MKQYCLFLLLFIVFIYSILIERKLLRVKNIKIKKLNTKITEKLKIAQITDIHLGKFFSFSDLEKLINKLNKQDVDIVVFTGDLIDKLRFFTDEARLISQLKKINARIGKFAVYGNHDAYPSNRKTYLDIMTKANFKVLINENIKLNINNKTLNILGLDDIFQGKINIESTTKNLDKDNFNLLLLHEPDLIENFFDKPIDLALAGHSHGGQIYIPLYGTIINTGEAVMYDKGLYKLGSDKQLKLFVNSGIGSTGLPIRFCNIPLIAVFNIEF